jgi:integrase
MATKKTRRPPGAGHLFTRTTQAGAQVWYGKWYSEGRQIKRKIGLKRGHDGAGLDRREAEHQLRRLAAEIMPPPHSRVGVQEAGTRLIEHLEALGRKPATTEGYESLLRVHLVSYLADRSLDSIAADDLEGLIRSMANAGKSSKTIRNTLGLLHSIFEYALRKGWAHSNPCKLVDKPREDGGADIRFLDPEEVEAVIRAELDVADELAPTLSTMYRTAAMTGLRQGELVALRWLDIDWPAAKLRVRRTYVRGEFSTPKSQRGSRSLPLADELSAQLERHFQRSAFQGDDDLAFGHPRFGRPLDRSRVRKRFKRAVANAGVRSVRFHDLRHTFGTHMAGAGVPMRTLQEWMGHRDYKTTLIYADYAPSEREREWIEKAFARPGVAELGPSSHQPPPVLHSVRE